MEFQFNNNEQSYTDYNYSTEYQEYYESDLQQNQIQQINESDFQLQPENNYNNVIQQQQDYSQENNYGSLTEQDISQNISMNMQKQSKKIKKDKPLTKNKPRIGKELDHNPSKCEECIQFQYSTQGKCSQYQKELKERNKQSARNARNKDIEHMKVTYKYLVEQQKGTIGQEQVIESQDAIISQLFELIQKNNQQIPENIANEYIKAQGKYKVVEIEMKKSKKEFDIKCQDYQQSKRNKSFFDFYKSLQKSI